MISETGLARGFPRRNGNIRRTGAGVSRIFLRHLQHSFSHGIRRHHHAGSEQRGDGSGGTDAPRAVGCNHDSASDRQHLRRTGPVGDGGRSRGTSAAGSRFTIGTGSVCRPGPSGGAAEHRCGASAHHDFRGHNGGVSAAGHRTARIGSHLAPSESGRFSFGARPGPADTARDRR